MKYNPGSFFHNRQAVWYILMPALVLGAYFPLIFNGFVSWDDEVYILQNPLVRELTVTHLAAYFTQTFEGHYHPLTLLSLALDYRIWGPDPLPFHLVNLLLHLANTFLVFFFLRKLCGKIWVAGTAALLFGLHPMHVEAVAWATARKDVLYSFFFLLSMLSYLRYTEKSERKWFDWSMVLAILSILSKGQGVFLPFCLILIDYFRGAPLAAWKTWRNKIPFLVVAVLLGVAAYWAQKSTGYIGTSTGTPQIWMYLLTASYSLGMYLVKMLIPVSLSAYYPIPDLLHGAHLWMALASLILSAGGILWMVKSFQRNRPVFFGLMFFLVNIVVFLRWIPVSNYIIADRYTYLSSIGLFLLAGYGVSYLREVLPSRLPSMLLIAGLVGSCTFLTFERVGVWRNSASLLGSILSANPDVYPALNGRGVLLEKSGDLTAAMADFNRAIAVQPQQARAWKNRASLHYRMGKNTEALHDITQALQLDPGNADILSNRGLIYESRGEVVLALKDFDRAIALNPSGAQAYNNRGKVRARQGKFTDAISDFTRALELEPSLILALVNRGKAYNQSGDFQAALTDLQEAVTMGARSGALLFETGFAYYNLKDFYKASLAFDQAILLQGGNGRAYAFRGYTKYNTGDFSGAEADLTAALQINPEDALSYGIRGMARIRLHKNEAACADFSQAAARGLTQVHKEQEKYCMP